MDTRERCWGKWSRGLWGLCSTFVTPETDKALQPWTKWGGGITMLEKDARQPATTQNTKQMLPNLAFLKTVRSSGWA